MTWLIENWYLLIVGLALIGTCACMIYRFIGLPNDKQVEKVKEWLIWACVEAEKALQSGTGQLKLREVWNKFCAVPSFNWISRIITFETFSGWVSESLSQVKQMIVSNDNLADYVYGDRKEQEVEKIKKQMGKEKE